MGPACSRGVERVIAAIRVRLQDAGIPSKLALRMGSCAVAGVVIADGGRVGAAKGAVVANGCLDSARYGLAGCHDGHGRIVTMDALAGEDVRLDEIDQAAQQDGAVACRWLSRPVPRSEQKSRFELPQRRDQQVRRHTAGHTDGRTADLDDQHVGRAVVDLGRIRMNGHRRKASRLPELAAKFVPPTVDRRPRDVDIARDRGNRLAKHNGCLH